MPLSSPTQITSPLRTIIRWGLYPFSWLIIGAAFFALLSTPLDPRRIWMMVIGALALLYLIIEFLFPYEKRWSMTLASFLADFKYAALNTACVAALSSFLALFAITLAGQSNGIASEWPIFVQLICALLVFESINYTLHRAMHELRGPFGGFLWRSHAAHHLPPRLYLVMHAVFHPFNGLIIQTLAILLPIWFMGYNEIAVVMFLIINGAHGLISHFNVDIRMGYANYIFVGPELHRYHHSADIADSKNYGATLSIFDQLFGTFVYRPGTAPKNLGVSPNSGLPAYENLVRVLRLPFRR